MIQVCAQIFAHLAFDVCGMCNQLIQRSILIQPPGCCFGTNLGNPWNIVRGISHQCQVIDNLFGFYTKFFHHALFVKPAVVHGVDQRDTLIDQLGKILVAG